MKRFLYFLSFYTNPEKPKPKPKQFSIKFIEFAIDYSSTSFSIDLFLTTGIDITAAAFDLISLTKDCLQKKNDKLKKTTIRFDALESKFPDIKCFAPGWRRPGYITKLTVIKLQYKQEVAGKNS